MRPEISRVAWRFCLAMAGGWQALAGQGAPAETKLQFEVASVKPAAEAIGPVRAMMIANMRTEMRGVIPMPDPGRVRIEGWSLRDLIAAAWRVREDQVSGPVWMDDQRFDIEARMPPGAVQKQAAEMLQTLLAERFGLELHHESQEAQGFALVVGKHGAKLTPADPEPAPPAETLTLEERGAKQKEQVQKMLADMQARRQSGEPMVSRSRSAWSSVTTGQLAESLVRSAGGPVVDETGLTGKYKVELFTQGETADQPAITIFDAVEKLGLKLEPRKVTVDRLVIDKLSKTPTAN